MFESVGHTDDPERGRRSALASSVLAALVGAVVVAVVVQPEPAQPPPIEPETDMVLLFDVPNEPDAAWELPEPPEPAPVEELEPSDTGFFDTAIPGMDPEEREREREGDTGVEGEDTGRAAGDGTDVLEPEPAPEPVAPRPGPRQPTPEPVVQPEPEPVYEIGLRNRLRPNYPSSARRREMGDVTCRMAVWVDRDGEARRVESLSCPPIFRAHARVALLEARWEPFDAPDTNTWRRTEFDVPFEM